MYTLLSDLRFALRTLRKSPAFTLIAIVSIALGVGANAAMFSFADAILLRPLPVPRPDRVVAVDAIPRSTRFGSMSYADYADLRDHSRTFSDLVCYTVVTKLGLSTDRDAIPRVALGMLASGNFFSGLQIPISL